MASVSSLNPILPSSSPSENNTTTLRDASFSLYLDNANDNYIHSLVNTSKNLNYNPRPKKVEDGEIDVFSADKYFNRGVVQEGKTNITKHNQAITNLSKLDVQPRTPSIYSESSMNSQSALLRRVQRNPSRRKSSFLSSCYCCDKESVDIQNNDHVNKSMYNGYERPMARTIKTSLDTSEITRLNKLRSDAVSSPLTAAMEIQPRDEEETQRKKSLEVFGSDEGSKRFSLEKRLKMLSWDAIPRSVEQIMNNSGPPSETCKDTESDASSDLFEIECISCTANPVMGQDGIKKGYAPSEASIDWSVVTASDAPPVSDVSVTGPKMVPKPVSSVKQRSAGMLTAGCKSQKAVSVIEDVSRSSVRKKSGESQRIHKFSDGYYSPVTRFQAEAKLPGHGVRHSKTPSSSEILFSF